MGRCVMYLVMIAMKNLQGLAVSHASLAASTAITPEVIW